MKTQLCELTSGELGARLEVLYFELRMAGGEDCHSSMTDSLCREIEGIDNELDSRAFVAESYGA